MSGFPVKQVANSLLQRDFEDGTATISPMKLQKLVYNLHGWHLAITGEPAIDEKFEVWPYGPVEDTLYHIFKNFRSRPIDKYATQWEGDKEVAYVVNGASTQFYEILGAVSKKYMPMSALTLSSITHLPGSPWSIAKENGDTYISNEIIRDYFRNEVIHRA